MGALSSTIDTIKVALPQLNNITGGSPAPESRQEGPSDMIPTFSPAESAAEALAQAQRMVDQIIEAGQPWTDPDFPPSSESLANEDDSTEQREKMLGIEWMRASELMPDAEVFQDEISPNDINQGYLGNCYFLCTLSSMAERPDSIKARFYTQKKNEAGIYLVTFYLSGLLTAVVVDDYLPVRDGQIQFASSRENEMWVMLLEKAWAKMLGSYARTEAGYCSNAAIHLMGVPAQMLHHEIENKEKLWRKIKQADQRNFTLMTGTKGEGEEDNGLGIISGHAYSLISAHEVYRNDVLYKLLKLRNPWGNGEWLGDWSDKSPIWTPELRKELEIVDEDDGIFVISFEDYLKYYSDSDISLNDDKNVYSHSQALEDFASTDQIFFTFQLENPIDTSQHTFSITCIQQGDAYKSYRCQYGKEPPFNPSEFEIMLMTTSGKLIKAAQGGSYYAFNFSLVLKEPVLEAGSYTFLVRPHWNQEASFKRDYKRVLVDIYCPQQVKISKLAPADGARVLSYALNDDFPHETAPEYVEISEISDAEMLEKTKETDSKQIVESVTYQLWNTVEGACILVTNNNPEKSFKVSFTFDLKNLKIAGSDRSDVEMTVYSGGGTEACYMRPVELGQVTSIRFLAGSLKPID